MISVILYGRNDSHGYNLHKRAAISLNCVAEVLTHPDDEILFVDYNTPNDLPTFIEAIYDTLTPAAQARLRVFRVRPELHARLAGPTHLAALEPHSRNIAIRRSNPRNRWILLTNTDMIFLARPDYAGLSGAVEDLADGLYIVPRFELPEPLWETFPRTDPKAVMRACGDLGRQLHLEEVTLAYPDMRFDQPGDFQLVPRQALWDIHGFDERMIHGWHADTNMCRRFYLYYGNRTESLAGRVKGYHCDHTRVATLAHRTDVRLENDVEKFVFAVEDPFASHQAETWGAPAEPVEELDFRNGPQALFITAVTAAVGAPQAAEYFADATDQRIFVAYHAEHVLPHLAANLTTYPRTARFAYIGSNPRMCALASRCIAALGFSQPLFDAGVAADAGLLLANYDLLFFDFGLDADILGGREAARVTDWPREQRHRLGEVAKCLETCAGRAGALGAATPEFIVINANHHIFRRFAGQFLLLSETPYATHVRKGRARIGGERLYRPDAWKSVEDEMRSYFGYGDWEDTIPRIVPGQGVDFTPAGQSGRYKDGHWGAMDSNGTWIDGHTAAILFAPPEEASGDIIAHLRVTEAFIGPDEAPIRVRASFEGEVLAHWTLLTRNGVAVCRVLLPARLFAGKSICRLELHVENPQSGQRVADAPGRKPNDCAPRELGIKIQEVAFTTTDPWHYSMGETLDFTSGGNGVLHTSEGWDPPDELGMWTLGHDSAMVLWPRETSAIPVLATFTINDAAIDPPHADLAVEITVNDAPVARWTQWHSREIHQRTAILPAECFRSLAPIRISVLVRNPRSSLDLGWSNWDKRPRGIRLNKLKLAPVLQYHHGHLMDFTAGGPAVAFVGDSLGVEWALPDAWGFWTVGPRAHITVPFDQTHDQTRGQAAPMTVVISDCMVSAAKPKLPVTVKANGQTVAEWVLDSRKPHARTFQLPAAVLDKPELTITFEIADPRSPADFGWGSDANLLGLRLALASIGRTQIEVPDFEKRSRVGRILAGARDLLKR